MGKTSYKAKNPPDEFQVTTPKNPLIKNQVVTSIMNLIITLNYPKVNKKKRNMANNLNHQPCWVKIA